MSLRWPETMPATVRSAMNMNVSKGRTLMTKPKRRRSSSNRLTKADMQALTVLDRLVEEDRRVEQHYDLPFRSPRQVATSMQPCAHCHQDIAWLIFGDDAKDAAGLEAYARLMADAIKQKGLSTY